jgi:ribonuclease BN (tRNA processing enzyme)
LDLGQGSFPNLASTIEPSGLAAVLVSHLHPDHFVDLVALRHYLRYEFNPPRAVRVIAPAGLAGRLDGVTGEPGFAAGALEIEDRAVGHIQAGPFDIESVPVTHNGASFATRVTLVATRGGRGLVYSGDCGRASDLAPLIGRGDALLIEVAFGPGPVPVPDLHLDGTAAGCLAARTGASQVLLTHLQLNRDPAATLAAVRAEYAGPVSLVSDGDRVAIPG